MYSWFAVVAPNTKFTDGHVVEVLDYLTTRIEEEANPTKSHMASLQMEDEEFDVRRNVANVGYYQRGRDYQWERDDLEPGHWEDHISTPDWRMDD
ncbi:hypothetical protein [Methylovulum miyakonense]|uniref:hypothetical protein n=1 Tax=Methylovulum miyakonense TaxID=645578 RepID=UPI000369A220|nr:hypothetical protein [Methylovulum miyakonense]